MAWGRDEIHSAKDVSTRPQAWGLSGVGLDDFLYLFAACREFVDVIFQPLGEIAFDEV
jgi:hypothetical protein